MAWNGMRTGAGRLALALVIVLAAACGGEDPVVVDPLVSPLVGDWTATAMVITSVANPDVAPELIGLGASFTLNVQPSGQYTAILIYAEQASTEIGFLSISGNVVTMTHSFPDTKTTSATYVLAGNRLTLDGDTDFDFNLDGTPEPALAHFELERR
ncbi:MAG TPA: hypothetical protein VLA36_03825 [Longimicrobiales bacterium]|nr:hypothetical protein [Longimicrobiales bacterium]